MWDEWRVYQNKRFINCKQLRELVGESEQLMRDDPSMRYDPRFNVKCLLGVSITREFLPYLVGMLT